MVDGLVATGLERVEQRVLRVVRAVLTYLALPATAWVVWVEVTAARASVWLGVEAIVIAGTTGVLWSRARRRTKFVCVVGMLVAISGFAVVLFGPTIGTGLFFLLAMTFASFFLGPRGSIIVLGVLACELGAATLAATLGDLQPLTFAPRPVEWLRMSITSVLALAVLGGLITAVQRAMFAAVEAEARARTREQATHLERENMIRARGASQRLEALGRLAGGVAHDLNNALVVVQTNAELLQTTEEPREREQLLQELLAGIGRATGTARQLRVFGSSAPSRGARARPARVIEEVVAVVGRVIPADITIEARVSTSATIDLSPAELDQILLNLILNARDAMPDGGHIVVTCQDRDGQVVLEVQDDGIGMPPEVRAHLFEPFFTTKPESGTGLGLANVWSKVGQCGGTIQIDSAPGRGTTCTLRFAPVADPLGEAAPASPATATPARSRPASVLVLEDQEDVRRTFERLLRRRGLVVEAVDTVREAITRLEAQPYDLFLTDGMVADGSSEAAIRVFRARMPSTPIIVCSGYVDEATFKLDEQLRDSLLFAPKPFETSELLALVERALSRPA